MKEKYVVTLRGNGVFHECVLVCIVDDIEDVTIRNIQSYIQTKYDISVYDFGMKLSTLFAFTSKKDIKVFVEKVELL